ncbi:MAG: pyridoxamine 5'-phosphate oxidase family protein [Chloroflexi bacterium]|nr:pyridoxamine 5'-phosphate oxidase family protein [Chloroflexota bacterium]
MQSAEGDIRLLGERVRGITIAMMTSAEEDGTLHTRPMVAPDREFDGDLWFFTYADAPKVGEMERDRHVSLSYARPEGELYVAAAGTAQLVRDRQKVQDLWTPSLQTWFPGGSEDPRLALLQVRVERAEYWEGKESRMLSFGPA